MMLIFLSYWTIILDAMKICKANWVRATCLASPEHAKVAFCIWIISVEKKFSWEMVQHVPVSIL